MAEIELTIEDPGCLNLMRFSPSELNLTFSDSSDFNVSVYFYWRKRDLIVNLKFKKIKWKKWKKYKNEIEPSASSWCNCRIVFENSTDDCTNRFQPSTISPRSQTCSRKISRIAQSSWVQRQTSSETWNVDWNKGTDCYLFYYCLNHKQNTQNTITFEESSR